MLGCVEYWANAALQQLLNSMKGYPVLIPYFISKRGNRNILGGKSQQRWPYNNFSMKVLA